MRVHELAKELNINSKELLEFLSSKNEKIKTSSNSVSEDEIALAKKQFVKKEQKPVTENKPELKETKEVKETKEQPKEESVQAPKQDAPVKKKIVSVYNPQNSGRKDIRDSQRKNNNKDRNRNGSNDNRRNEKPIDRPQGIRPLERPQGAIRPSDRVNVKPDRPQGDRPQRSGDRPYGERNQGDRPQRNNNRHYGERNQGDRPQRNGDRPYGERNQGDRPQRNGDRPYGDRNQGDRPQRTNDRPARNGGRFNDKFQGGKPEFNKEDNGSRPQRNNDRPARRDDRNSGAFDGADALKDREAKDQRNRDRENNRKKNNDFRDKTEKLENTKALEKNLLSKKKKEEADEDVIKTLILPDTLTIKELADKMKVQPTALVKNLFLKGQIVTINQDIDFATAEEIALEYNCICEHEVKVDVIAELLKDEDDPEDTLVPRPPVVCVMGHVDHGKTSLLDAIRSSKVTEKEAGGITQHIGAYTVDVNGQSVTFLDTPGHEAFTAMRLRGAKSTDIAILVVAADDGVMPQTIEAINHAKAAGIDIVVAVNKIDKPSANVERVKQELTEYDLIAEDWGGSTIFCPVSAHTGEGIDNLLEMLLLTAEMRELKANPNRKARGLVIEAKLDKGRGPVATILVQKGTLHVGDFIAVGPCHGKVRAMIDDKGRRINEAGPSTPVEIIGLNDVPNAGDIFISPKTDKEAKTFAETFIAEGKNRLVEETKSKMSLEDLFSQIQAGNLKELDIIVKADVQGSVEAVKQSLVKLSNDEVIVKVIHAGVGAINESDVILASASNAIIIGFNVRPDNQARDIAERENVDLRLYRVIYQAIEDVEAAMKGMLDPKYEEKVIGTVEVRQTYKASVIGTIAGSYVLDGMVTKNSSVRVTRGDDLIYDGPIASLKRFKDDVKEVKAGYECGIVLEKFNDIKEGDMMEVYTMVEIPR
ncbi:translation initiation factor IF-2 [Eshraghiella crossota]|uniref:translation initiation factor IF-2 n=1 Tax=Eshraghiella crossota TaxID=45851 RepID=UPI003FF036ED